MMIKCLNNNKIPTLRRKLSFVHSPSNEVVKTKFPKFEIENSKIPKIAFILLIYSRFNGNSCLAVLKTILIRFLFNVVSTSLELI